MEFFEFNLVKAQRVVSRDPIDFLMQWLQSSNQQRAGCDSPAEEVDSNRAQYEEPLIMDCSTPNIALVELDQTLSSSTTNLLETT